MPLFTEFLFAPWKIFKVLGFASNAASAAATGGPPTPSGLCYGRDIGGEFINVCRVGGYEMPSFVFWASLLILLLFSVACYSMLTRCFQIANALARIAEQVPGEGHLDAEGLARIGKLMRQETVTSHAWNQFEETLLSHPGKEGVFATLPVDSVLSRSALIEENVNSSLYNSVPGVLTGLGLLMTFVAILDGLSHVSVAANMDVKGIGGLINGLSGKFVSSIVAVSCAVAFVFVERIAYARPQAAYRSLVGRLGSIFRRRTTEHLLHSILTELSRGK